jgi:hypothetical protein
VTTAENRSLIDKLSDTEKDELIVRLWGDLQEARARADALEARLAQVAPGTVDTSTWRRAERAGAPAPASPNVKLGRGLAFLRSKVVLGAAIVIALAFAADYAVGLYQRHRLETQRLAALQLQHLAYQGMFFELVNVVYEPDEKSYRATMRMSNVDPSRPIYLMQGPMRVFEQVGLAWKEVPARSASADGGVRVIKLIEPITYETVFEPNQKDFTELMPGYMHIRFDSVSLVSERSDPDDDIVERTDRYNVYLKPHGADDEAIRRRMKIAGQPPVYMPMPPH